MPQIAADPHSDILASIPPFAMGSFAVLYRTDWAEQESATLVSSESAGEELWETGGGRDGIGRWLRQGKRRTHKSNMDNIAINNHKGGA